MSRPSRNLVVVMSPVLSPAGWSLLAALALVGCGGGKAVDGDGDGYAAADDCDDDDADVNPGADEVCNGIDDNCADGVDEGVLRDLFGDGDGDGFGDPDRPVQACAADDGAVEDDGDCDDADRAVNPGADETCNGDDDDCDGAVDEGVLLTLWVDGDGDGHGDPRSTVQACGVSDGVTDLGDDCRDDRADIFPGAFELCDGIDQDCDLAVDEEAIDATQYYDDDDGDGFGDPNDPVSACQRPLGSATTGDDCDDTVGRIRPGATEFCNGVDDDCDFRVDEDAIDQGSWWLDSDGDGWGTGAPIVACEAPSNRYVGRGGDCDDASRDAYPTAIEQCNAIDEDCDGDTEDVAGAVSWYADADGDGYGLATDVVVDCARPSGYAPLAGDCAEGDPSRSPGAVEVCNAADDDCDGAVDDGVEPGSWYSDLDGDGYGSGPATSACARPSGFVAAAGDCAEGDASRNPGAAEQCDGVDQDCDGTADDGLPSSTWYPDGDGDGFGAIGEGVQACRAPAAHVAAATDCDDGDAGAFPGAAEVCDGGDDDCDGAVDEGLARTAWYLDDDGDGFGRSDGSVLACARPSGRVEQAGDCDDGSAEVSPGRTEVCNGIDDDCDVVVDEGVAITTWYRDDDEDGWGDARRSVQSCTPPAGHVDRAGDCNDAVGAVSPGAAEVCNGADDDCDLFVDEDAVDGQTWFADLDADGYGDAASTTTACARPAGYVAAPGDCNDLANPIRPGQPELCNDVDDDCDGRVDNAAIDQASWYLDNDGDGFGRGVPVTACDAPSAAHVTRSGDCDDGARTINPAALEVCNGDVDDDCNPSTDEQLLPTTPTWYFDADGDGYGDPADGIQSCAALPNRVQGVDDDCDDQDGDVFPGATETCNFIDDDCDGRIDPACTTEHCGTIAVSETWAAGRTHVVTCDIYVQGGARPTLTIADGARVAFRNGTGLFVATGGEGRLVVNGGALGVTMTSEADAPQPGQWRGVHIGSFDRNSTLTGLTIEYGGGNSAGGLYLSGSSPTLTRLTVRSNLYDGIRVQGGFPTIAESVIEGNSGRGVSIDPGAGLARGLVNTNSFRDNVVTGNGDEPVAIPPNFVDELDPSTVLTGNGLDEVFVHAGTVDANRTWGALDVRYKVAGDVYVQGSANPRLTLADGATLAFNPNVSLWVGVSDRGALLANGATDGVTLTSARANPEPGDWGGLYLGSQDSGTSLTGVTVELAGSANRAAVYAAVADPTLDRCTLRYNREGALFAQSGDVLVTNTSIHDNLDGGVWLDDGSTLRGAFAGNTVTANAGVPVRVPAAEAWRLATSSTYTGNEVDLISLGADTVATSQTWADLGAPFRVEGVVYVQDAANPALTIADGVDLTFNAAAGLWVGISARGRLLVNGGAQGVTMTHHDPAARWYGLQFGSLDQGSALTGLELSHAGTQGSGAIYTYGPSLSVVGSDVHDNVNAGLYAATGTITVQGSVFADNTEAGVYLADNAGLARGAANVAMFSGNLMSGNAVPMVLPANFAGELDPSSAFTGNDLDRVLLLADTIDASQTWAAMDADYQVQGTILVEGAANPRLVVEDGVVLRFVDGAAFYVGNSATGVLDVRGTDAGVLFTSASASPAPGAWSGLHLSSLSDGSILDGLTLEYGGRNGAGGIYATYTSFTVRDSVIRDNAFAGIYLFESSANVTGSDLTDNQGDGLFANAGSSLGDFGTNDATGNDGYAMVIPANHAGKLQTTSTYTGNGAPAVALSADTIEASQTWRDLGVPFRVLGDLYVEGANNPVLTLLDGVELQFAQNTSMYVGNSANGTLLATGGAAGVTFTAAGSEQPGFWRGLWFGSLDRSSALRGATVEYGGSNGYGNIVAYGSALVVEDTTSRWSARSGLYGYNAVLDVTGSTFADNSDHGVFVDGSSRLAVGTPSFTDNAMTGNDLSPIVLPPDSVGELDASSTYAGNGDAVRISGGYVRASATWQQLDEDYVVGGTVYVEGPNNPVVTVEDGVRLAFDRNHHLYVGNGDDGLLDVQGGTLGVVFTSSAVSPAPNDWGGIWFGQLADGSRLVGATVEYGGYNGYGNVVGWSAAPLTITDSVIRLSGRAGVYLVSSNAEISGTALRSNNDQGLYADAASGLVAAVSPSFRNNVVTANGRAGVDVPPEAVRQLASSSTYAGNADPVVIQGGYVRTSGVWRDLDEAYRVTGDVYVEGPINPLLTVEGGTTLRMASQTDLWIGNGDDGAVVFDGASARITITSAATNPARGDWGGVWFGQYDLGSALTDTTVEYGGANGWGNVVAYYTDVPMEGLISRQSSKSGVYLYSGTAAVSDSALTDNNDWGLYADAGSQLTHVGAGQPTFTGNTVTRNGRSLGILAESLAELDPTSTFVGNLDSRVNVYGGYVRRSATWHDLDVDVFLSGDVYVEGPLNPIVTVAPGSRFQFGNSVDLYVGNGDDGGLVARGTGAAPIVFTSAQGSPGNGDWSGLWFGDLCIEASTSLDQARIEFGGANGYANVVFYYCNGSISNSTVSRSSRWGIYRIAATPTVSGISYSGNNDGNLF